MADIELNMNQTELVELEFENPETCIGWRNLRFESRRLGFNNLPKKTILNRLNGYFDYHTLNAFMGPSGAGKTTLLNCLSGNRIEGLTNESEIFLNKDQRDGTIVSYFIRQHVEQTIVGKMNVRHILQYAYRFKNSGNTGKMKEQHIRSIVKEMLLDENVLDRKFEQCSGGEQKRIAIAQELMSLRKPTLLFVDEPTTGLDSNAAHLVMKCLKQLATKHRMTVVTSIHVPSDEILNLFDKLYVLAKGGVCIYSGPPDQLKSHLETEIKDLNIPYGQPPIEFLTKIACTGIADSRVSLLAEQNLTAEYRNVTDRLEQLDFYPNGVPNHRKLFTPCHFLLQIGRMFRITFVSEIMVLFFMLLGGLYYITFLSALFSSDMILPDSCYPLFSLVEQFNNDSEPIPNSELNNPTCTNQIENDSLLKQNILFHGSNVGYIGFSLICMYSVLFGPYARVFRNEYRNQWYSLGVFYWAHCLVTFSQASVFAILYALYGYVLTNQHYVDHYELNPARIGYFVLYLVIVAIYAQSIGQVIGVFIVNNITMAVIVGAMVGVISTMFSGHLVDLEFSESLLVYLARLILPVNNIFKALINIVYGFGRCNPETEYSLAILNNHVDEDKMVQYATEVLLNLVVVRLFLLAYMYWQFNSFTKRSVETVESKLPIECNETNSTRVELDTDKDVMSIAKKSKQHDEIKFEKFSRGKTCVAWRNLSLYGTSFVFEQAYSSAKLKPSAAQEKAILKNLNGQLYFGSLNAVMGTSGAGKTSLLKVLNGQNKTRLSAQSQFYLSKFTRIQTCFITQDVSGHLLPGLTAKQTLVYASRLKNSELRHGAVDSTQIDHQQIALNLLEELKMSNIGDTLVEKCSGGERKRLALALEMTAVQMPNLICIDEPTSGLDSNSAEVVVSCLLKLTQTHSITIVASIHQPNTEVLLMFDQIYVLARGGVCIYSGDPNEIVTNLDKVPEIYLSENRFPIETLIKHSCSAFPEPIVHQLMTVNNQEFFETIVDSGLLESEAQQVSDGIQQNRRRFSLLDTWILCARYLAYIRGHLWFEWLVYLVLFLAYGGFLKKLYEPQIAIPSGCLNMDEDFNNTCSKTEEKIIEENLISYNIQFLSFAFGWFFALVLIQSSLTFGSEAVYFYNEHRNGWYSTGSFYLTKSLFATVPYILVLVPYCYICNIYESLIPGMYYQLLGLMALSTLAYQGLSNLVGIFGRIHILLLIFMGVSVFLMNIMLSNLFVPIASTHYVFRHMSKLSVVSYLLDALTILQYGFGRCLPKQFQPVMYLFSLEDSDYYRCILATLALLVVFHMSALGLLIYFSNPEPDRRQHIQRVNKFVRKLQPPDVIIPGIGSPNEFRIKQIRF